MELGEYSDKAIVTELWRRMTCRATADTITLPSAPVGLTLGATDTGIVLDWTDNVAAEGVTNYKVYRGTNQGGPFTLKSSPVPSTYTDLTASSNTTYWYRVSAVNSSGEGPYTEITGQFTLDIVAPGEVTITSGPTQVGASAVRLTWTDPVDSDYAGAKVYGNPDGAGYSLLSGSQPITIGEFTHSPATLDVEWIYKIVATDTAGNVTAGVFSAPITLDLVDTTPPDAPTGVVATGRSDGILITWTPNTEYDLAFYNVYRSDDFVFPVTDGDDLSVSPTSFLDTSATVGVPYTYKVDAVDGDDNSSAKSSASNSATRLETSVNSLDSFIKTGTMVPCVCHARGIDYRKYTAVDSGSGSTSASTVTFVENLDFTALAAGTLLTANYVWNFAAGAGQAKGLFSDLKGFNAAHAYDSPGKYTVQLTRTDENGKADSFTSTINLAPDTRTIIYVSPTGSSASSNPGTSSSSPVSVARAQAILNASANVKVRLQNGATFTSSGTMLTLLKDNQMIEGWTFGTSSTQPPICKFAPASTGTRSMFVVKATGTNAVIQNLTIDRGYTPANDAEANRDQGFALYGECNALIRNITFNHVGTGVTFDVTGKTSRYVLVQGCRAPLRDSLNEYFSFVKGQDLVFLGNTAVNSMRAHVLRCSEHNRTLVAYNTFTDQNNQNIDTLDITRTPLTVQHGVDFYAYRNTLAADIDTTNSPTTLSRQLGGVSFGPLRESNGHKEQYSKNYVVEANTFNCKVSTQSGLTDAMFRNNIINRRDSQSIQVTPLTGTDAGGRAYDLPNARLYFINNTFYNSGKTGTFVQIGSSVDTLEIVNNHGIAPTLSTNTNQSLVADFRGGFGSNNKVQRNVFCLSDNYRISSVVESTAVFNKRSQAGGTNIREATTVDSTFKPASNSACATAARPKAGVFDDIKGSARGKQATTWTAGAYQV